MLDRLKFKGISDYLRFLPSLGKGKSGKGLCALTLSPQGISLACTSSPQEDKPVLSYCEFHPCEDTTTPATLLPKLVENYQLSGYECIWVLQPGDYSLLLQDLLPVPDAELRNATRWKIKELLDFPLSEAAIDVFPLSPYGSGEQEKKMYVVVSRLNHLKEGADIIESAGLNLTTIDITEMALRNLAVLGANDTNDIACLQLKEDSSYLLLYHDRQLFLTREISIGLNQMTGNPLSPEDHRLDPLVLELQRTFDYYANQMRLPMPALLLLTPQDQIGSTGLDHLSASLSLSAHTLLVDPLFSSEEPLSLEQTSSNLLALGGLLRNKVYDND